MDNQIIQKKYCLYARKSSEEDERQALSQRIKMGLRHKKLSTKRI